MTVRLHDFWQRLSQHPVCAVIGLLGSLCSIASLVLSLIGTVPFVWAVVVILVFVMLVAAGYWLLGRPSNAEALMANPPRQDSPVAIRVEHDDTLIAQDALGAMDDIVPKDAALYAEATERLRNGQLAESLNPAVTQAIGDAIHQWVAMAHRLLATGYPGYVHTPEKKKKTINLLHRAAYKWMRTGRVVKFAGDANLRTACLELVRCVTHWVELELMKRH
jgi:hypothetical protein